MRDIKEAVNSYQLISFSKSCNSWIFARMSSVDWVSKTHFFSSVSTSFTSGFCLKRPPGRSKKGESRFPASAFSRLSLNEHNEVVAEFPTCVNAVACSAMCANNMK